MATIKDAALNYESGISTIAELKEVATDFELYDAEFEDENGKKIPYQYTIVDGKSYRVPKSVLKQLQTHLNENASLQKFKVRASGTGMNTQYTVIPL